MRGRERGVGVSGKFEPSKMSLSAEPGRKSDIARRVVWRRIGLEQNFTEIASKLQIASSTAHRIFTRHSHNVLTRENWMTIMSC